MSEHSPLPWAVNEGDIWCTVNDVPNAPLFKPDLDYRRWGRDISRTERAANAALIVNAVNAHADLVAALRSARRTISSMGGDLEVTAPESINANSYRDDLRRINEALKKAGAP